MLDAFLLLLIAAVGAWLVTGPILWVVWYARRSFRSRQFSLWNLLFAFTIVTLLIGAFSAWLRGAYQ